ncbi:MAG: hypothetical protein IT290_03580, partial [Deltaproteobacteria bacterium]|nr:hypothetical protein [Deltaproteobacteria bacterium]
MRNQHIEDERGITIVFLAIIVVALMGMIGLPIDSGMLATTSSQYRHTAEYAVTSALETYLAANDVDGSGNPDYIARIDRAV